LPLQRDDASGSDRLVEDEREVANGGRLRRAASGSFAQLEGDRAVERDETSVQVEPNHDRRDRLPPRPSGRRARMTGVFAVAAPQVRGARAVWAHAAETVGGRCGLGGGGRRGSVRLDMKEAARLRTSPTAALVASVVAVAVVSGTIALIDDFVPVLSLGVLYILAVLTIAILFGSVYAIFVAVASMLAFNFFFLPPLHTFALSDTSNWFALTVYVATAIVVGTLAARSRYRAGQAEQREREAALLADVASELLRGTELAEETDRLAARASQVLGVSSARIELGAERVSATAGVPHLLTTGGATVGTLYTLPGEEPTHEAKRRLLPALAALLAVALERESLAREALEAETLRRSDAVKTAVIQAVSHDLRTPLATIEAALDGLQSGEIELSAEDRAGLLESVRLEHTRLKRLVEDLLDLSRLQAGAVKPIAELWPIEELLEEAIAALRLREQVLVATSAQSQNVRVDAMQIQRVLVNLLENAVRYSPPGEQVTVEVNVSDEELLIRVVDHGPGVPRDERERIFEPFHRLDSEKRGAGLGLAIARGFAQANGGRLWVEPADRRGSCFILALPSVRHPAKVEV
jgi:two-component system, OmpR family, sensor histidine kinase KdpD